MEHNIASRSGRHRDTGPIIELARAWMRKGTFLTWLDRLTID